MTKKVWVELRNEQNELVGLYQRNITKKGIVEIDTAKVQATPLPAPYKCQPWKSFGSSMEVEVTHVAREGKPNS